MFLALLALACGPKAPPAPPPPPVGWYTEAGWSGECFAPPDWESLDTSTRKMKRQEALEAMKAQWSGQKEEDVHFEDGMVENVEVTLLGRPDKIEAVTAQNQAQCIAYRKGGDKGAWESAVRALPGKLTAGECLTPFLATRFDYLDIQKGWQGSTSVCKGDKIRINATVKDRFRLKDNGAWMNVLGVGPAAEGAPCTSEGCLAGTLLGRFVPENGGAESIFVVGAEKVYTVPAHGTLTYGLNDDTWFDNTFMKNGSIIDATAVTLEPVE
jgi:hypothetical protein